MAKVAGDDDDLGNRDEDETLTELQKEYESEEPIGKKHTKPTTCQTPWQNVSQSPASKVLKEKLKRQA